MEEKNQSYFECKDCGAINHSDNGVDCTDCGGESVVEVFISEQPND